MGVSTRIKSGFKIGLRIFGVSVSILITGTTGIATSLSATSAFEDGRADRNAWETWFAGLTGDFRDGAEFWAARRSDPQQPSCSAPNRTAAFYNGCKSAKARLDPTDMRRKTEPEYKAGWNSTVEPPSSPSVATATAEPDPSRSPVPKEQRPSVSAVDIARELGKRLLAPSDNTSSVLGWSVVRERDKMSDVLNTSARAKYKIPGGGYFDVLANCMAVTMPIFGNNAKGFQILFTVDNADARFHWSSTNGERYVRVRTRLDDQEVRSVMSETDYADQAGVAYVNMNEGGSNTGAFWGGMMQAGISRLIGGTIDDLFSADRLRIELPLEDGRAPVIEIAPRDNAFKSVLGACTRL